MVWAICRMGAMGVVGKGWMGVGSRVPLGVDVARVLGGFSFWCFFRLRVGRDCLCDVVIIEARTRVDSGRNEGLKIALVQAF